MVKQWMISVISAHSTNDFESFGFPADVIIQIQPHNHMEAAVQAGRKTVREIG